MGVLVLARVPVCGGIGEADHLAFFDDLAMHFVVPGSGPVHVHERADPANDFFYRIRNEGRVLEERIVLLRIFG